VSGGHPAWQEILSSVPETLHPTIRPTLEKWDKGVEERLAQVHSQYEPVKWLLDNQVPKDAVEAGLQLYQALENDPKGFYEYLSNFLGINAQGGQGQPQVQQQDPNTVDLGEFGEQQQAVDPRFDQLAQQQQQMMQYMEAQRQAQASQEADIWLSSKQAQVTENYQKRGIDPDWDYILGVAAGKTAAGVHPDKAFDEGVAAYEAAITKMMTRPTANSSAPPVFAPSGGTPSTNFDASKLSDSDRRKMMVEMLTQANKD
jgi:hypothetical protein